MESTAPIGVYGATGYTGRLVATELLAAGRDVVLCGRSLAKLDALVEDLGDGGRDGRGGGGVTVDAMEARARSTVRTRAAALDDPAALRAAFADLAVVVNCAGPFVRCGAPVLEAAIATGTHYLDTTGEQPWIKRVFDGFSTPAREAGVTVVPGMGFDYAPADLLAHLVGEPLQPLRELTVAYALEDFRATRGTTRSALEQLGGGELVYVDGAWQPAPTWGPLNERFDFPLPRPRHRVARYPGGEIVMIPHHLDVREVKVRITSFTFAPRPLTALVPILGPAIGVALRSDRLRRAAEALVERLPEGPQAMQRTEAMWYAVVHAVGQDGREARGDIRGRDVYGITAQLEAQAAMALADGQALDVGVQPPAGAFAPAEFLTRFPGRITYALR